MMVLMGDPPVADGRELPGGQHVECALPASPLPSVFASPRAERFVPRRARQAPSIVGLRLWCERARADSLSGRRRFEPGPSTEKPVAPRRAPILIPGRHVLHSASFDPSHPCRRTGGSPTRSNSCCRRGRWRFAWRSSAINSSTSPAWLVPVAIARIRSSRTAAAR